MKQTLHHRCSLAKHCTRVNVVEFDQHHYEGDVPGEARRDVGFVQRVLWVRATDSRLSVSYRWKGRLLLPRLPPDVEFGHDWHLPP